MLQTAREVPVPGMSDCEICAFIWRSFNEIGFKETLALASFEHVLSQNCQQHKSLFERFMQYCPLDEIKATEKDVEDEKKVHSTSKFVTTHLTAAPF